MNTKLPKKYVEILFIIGMGLALIIAAITASLAWFTSNSTVSSQNTRLTSQDNDRLDVSIPDVSLEYDKYMGQTGTQYNGEDFPYFIEFTPVVIEWNFYDPESSTYFLRTSFSPSSFIDFVFASQPDEILTEEKLDRNFTMRFHLLEYNQETETYEETGAVFRPENGYLRNIETGELLRLGNQSTTAFRMIIYFQGEYAFRMLMDTQANIPSQYRFQFSDEIYMFATFNLYTLFEMKSLLTLHFNSTGYGPGFTELQGGYSGTPSTQITFTGASLVDENGNERDYPVPEIRNNGEIDYSLYFEDWFTWYPNAETGISEARIYRNEKSEGVYVLEETFLKNSPSMMNAKWNNSNSVILDLNYGSTPSTEYPLRPKGNYYSDAGYVRYDSATKQLYVYNPSGTSMQLCNSFTPPTRNDHTFVGWSLTPNGTENVFNSGNDYIITPDEDLELYAIWEETVDITFNIHETWGENYANVINGSISKTGTSLTLTNGKYVDNARILRDMFTYLSDFNISAFVDRTSGTDETLTLKGWKYLNASGIWEEITASTSFQITQNIQLYPIWNERKVNTITVDLYQTWRVVGISYFAACSFSIGTRVELDRYNLKFNDNYTGNFTGTSGNQSVVISNVPEGVSLDKIGLNISMTDKSTVLINYEFKYLATNSNDLNSSLNSYNPIRYDMTSAITVNTTVYVYCDNNL